MDLKTAFLYSQLKETVYMPVLEGVQIPLQSVRCESELPNYCRLLKWIYRLKQSLRPRYGRIGHCLRSNNLYGVMFIIGYVLRMRDI